MGVFSSPVGRRELKSQDLFHLSNSRWLFQQITFDLNEIRTSCSLFENFQVRGRKITLARKDILKILFRLRTGQLGFKFANEYIESKIVNYLYLRKYLQSF